jgi:hypothetical protein
MGHLVPQLLALIQQHFQCDQHPLVLYHLRQFRGRSSGMIKRMVGDRYMAMAYMGVPGILVVATR